MHRGAVDLHVHELAGALGYGREGDGLLLCDLHKRDAVDEGDLRRVEAQHRMETAPHHDGRDEIAGAGRVIVERAEHRIRGKW